jgi:hypothetical protein
MKTQHAKQRGVVIVALSVAFGACSAQSPSSADPVNETDDVAAAATRENVSDPSVAPSATQPDERDPSNASRARGKRCGGFAGLSCDEGQYCDFPKGAHCGAADRTGLCKPIPERCTKIYAPVCGCDDKTYSSACVAASNGVSVASRGACASSPGKLCGGFAGISCDKGQYCDYPVSAHCGAGDMSGTCQPTPELCTTIYAPVCGCDGKTYSSACVAARSGVSVAKEGTCEPAAIPEGGACGTLGTPGQCADGLYCKYHEQCGADDSGGSCEVKPDLCPDIFQEVCGCDGKTYPNACFAARAGVSTVHEGACVTPLTAPASK